MEFFKVNSGPLIALAGTLFVALLGYLQWRKQQKLAQSGNFMQERQVAYQTLWAKLEAVHLSIRTADFQEDSFHELIRTVNTHMINAALHLDRDEKKRVKDYLDALGALGRLLSKSAASEAKNNAVRSMHDTSTVPLSILTEVEGLQSAYNEVEQHRELLIGHFRKVLGAHLVS